MQIEVTDEIIDEVIEDYKKLLKRKIKQKGRYPFNSWLEIYGKLCEENYEVLQELHKKEFKKDSTNIENELLDMANVAIYGIASMRVWKNAKIN